MDNPLNHDTLNMHRIVDIHCRYDVQIVKLAHVHKPDVPNLTHELPREDFHLFDVNLSHLFIKKT